MRISISVITNLLVVLAISSPSVCDIPPVVSPDILSQTKSVGECKACKLFIESFKKGLERTTRGKFEGGDAAWEEEKLKTTYKNSEIRLIDIQEGICKESDYSVQCHHMAEKAEEYIEQWWTNQDESIDLYVYICIEKLRVCCPEHHYGKDCSPCLGDHNNLCNGNGRCRGDGTRKGNGTCLCDPGYEGDDCDECSAGYFLAYKDNTKMLCSMCHPACLTSCTKGTKKDCDACKPGYLNDKDEGCVDINECEEANICKKDEFCSNSIGSYGCFKCDKSCHGCYGDGPDACRKCAEGYSKTGEFCIIDRVQDDPMDTLTSTRYMTYIGLLIAMGVVLPISTSLGSIVGIAVLTYIVGAEYYCMINGHDGLVNLKQLDLMQFFRT